MRGFFDLLIGDEVHEFKARGSAQGIAAGVLADACGKSLSLTGTLLGGYASTIFHLLYRFSPEIRTEFGRSDEGRWIKRYGFEEHTIGKDDDEALEDGRNSRRRKFRKVVRERPGLVPSALFHIIGNTVFLRLSDVASGLPEYDEQILLSSMDNEDDGVDIFTQRGAYNHVFSNLKDALAKALKSGSKRLLATYLQTLLAYPDESPKPVKRRGSSSTSRMAPAQYTRLRRAAPTWVTTPSVSSRSMARWAVVNATSSLPATPPTVQKGFSAKRSSALSGSRDCPRASPCFHWENRPSIR